MLWRTAVESGIIVVIKSEDGVETSSREQQKYPKYMSNLFLVFKDYHREVEEPLHE